MEIEKYIEQIKRLPQEGKQIIGQRNGDNIIVYQAFNNEIAKYAIAHQRFGGPEYGFNRMSWIKPGFLWMMYRSGWASKENQEHVLAVSLDLEHFKTILRQATVSSYDEKIFETKEKWREELNKTDVRLQWDPDHDPFGNKMSRKAIQIGMKGSILKNFCVQWITKIEDITDFVRQEYGKVLNNNIKELMVPYEQVITIEDFEIKNKIGLI